MSQGSVQQRSVMRRFCLVSVAVLLALTLAACSHHTDRRLYPDDFIPGYTALRGDGQHPYSRPNQTRKERRLARRAAYRRRVAKARRARRIKIARARRAKLRRAKVRQARTRLAEPRALGRAKSYAATRHDPSRRRTPAPAPRPVGKPNEKTGSSDTSSRLSRYAPSLGSESRPPPASYGEPSKRPQPSITSNSTDAKAGTQSDTISCPPADPDCAVQLAKLLQTPVATWSKRPATAADYVSGSRLVAFAQLKETLTCQQMDIALDEAVTARVALSAAMKDEKTLGRPTARLAKTLNVARTARELIQTEKAARC